MSRPTPRWAAGVLSGAVALLYAAGCAPQPIPSLVTPEPALLFADDFSDVNSGWDRHSDRTVTADYEDGHYLISVEQPGVDVWGRPGLDLADAAVEVDATRVSGPSDGEFGLLCRLSQQGNLSSFYFFVITGDGQYAAGKVVKNRRTILAPADGAFRPAGAIQTKPDFLNRLSAVCAGEHMTFAVNGTPLAEFADSDLPRGDIGLMAGTFGEVGLRVEFDNVFVRKP